MMLMPYVYVSPVPGSLRKRLDANVVMGVVFYFFPFRRLYAVDDFAFPMISRGGEEGVERPKRKKRNEMSPF